MKPYFILSFLLLTWFSFSQDENTNSGLSGAYAKLMVNSYFQLEINDFLSSIDVPEIRNTSLGSGVEILHIPNKIGFMVNGGIDFNSNIEDNRRSSMTVLSGRIGPTFNVLSTDFQNTYFSAVYGFDYYNLYFSEIKNQPLDAENFFIGSGNTTQLSRNGHSIGGILAIDTKLSDSRILFKVGYFYTLNKSEYSASGFSSTEGFPREQNQIISFSLCSRFNNFAK